jgi:hypothetical protein
MPRHAVQIDPLQARLRAPWEDMQTGWRAMWYSYGRLRAYSGMPIAKFKKELILMPSPMVISDMRKLFGFR